MTFYIFAYISKLILPQSTSLAGVRSHLVLLFHKKWFEMCNSLSLSDMLFQIVALDDYSVSWSLKILTDNCGHFFFQMATKTYLKVSYDCLKKRGWEWQVSSKLWVFMQCKLELSCSWLCVWFKELDWGWKFVLIKATVYFC